MKPDVQSHSHPAKTKKTPWKVAPGPEAKERFTRIAERLDIPVATLASIALTELSFVRPDAFFEALGAIPADLKTRAVGRPAGSTNARKEEKNHAHAHAAA
jgi:hypothetical protein